MTDEIRQVLKAHGHLQVDAETLSRDADLFAAGMSSHASVAVMLALEDRFGIEFPTRMLRREVFESIGSIEEAIAELRDGIPS
jgi:acyl carrier protein